MLKTLSFTKLPKAALLNDLHQISRTVSAETKTDFGTGGLVGLAGVAMFQFYYSNFTNNNNYADYALENLEKSLEIINKGNGIPSFCSGIGGMGWILSHLKQKGFLDTDDSLLADIDEYVYEAMVNYINERNYDFLHGAIGCGFYFLKRYQNSNDSRSQNKYKNFLTTLIENLESSSIVIDNQVYWMSVIDESGKRGYNLGLAHGVASVVNFLSRLYLIKDLRLKVQKMLEGGINYILSYRGESKFSCSNFPSYIDENGKIFWNSRLAWCYGDLGIGLSLYQAGNALDDISLRSTSLAILNHASLRYEAEDTCVADAGLCHGSFGIAQIFNYMYRQTGHLNFRNAYHYWVNDGINQKLQNNKNIGYRKKTTNGWVDDISVLEGISGIGLAIISSLSKENISWDECLMIN